MKIVIDDACYAHQEIFANLGRVIPIPGIEITKDAVKDADILIVRSRTKINKNLLDGSKVSFVGSAVAGLDHVDQNYLKEANIQFFSAQGCNAMAVAEFVITTILNLSNNFGFDIQSKTLGIIGVGNVGSRLNEKAKILGISTLLNDPPRQERGDDANFVDLETALSADIVSFHTPLDFDGNHPTYHLLNKDNFHKIKNDSIVFNAARGGVIDESIWQDKKTLANIIDCWENEPNINQKLLNSAFLATPHIAGHSIDAKFKGSYMVYEALCDFLNVEIDPKIAKMIDPGKIELTGNNLRDCLNEIYDFSKDQKALQQPNEFEKYRRNYPIRYEWHHFSSKIKLPIA